MKIIEYKMYDFFTEDESFKTFYESLKSKDLQEITKEKYIKLFWFIYDGTKFNNEKNKDNPFGFSPKSFYQELTFINLSKIFFDNFISLMIESIEKSLDESNNQEITHLQQMFQVFFPFPWIEILDGFDRKSVDRLIEYFINLDFDIYQKLNDINRNQYILKLLLLDKLKHYEFIKELLKYDTKNSHSYLRTLYGMSSYGKSEKEIIEDFFDIYDKLAKDKKMDFYKSLADLAECNNEGKFFENIELKSLEMLLVDYYELFDGNTFYKDMNNDLFPKQPLTFVNNLWIYLAKKEYKSFLENKLIVHENRKLSTRAKIVLDRLYNSLGREKKDYKKILDEGRLPIVSIQDFYEDICEKLQVLKVEIEDNRNRDLELFYRDKSLEEKKTEDECRNAIVMRLNDRYGNDIENTREKQEGNNRVDINIRSKQNLEWEVQVECKRNDNPSIETAIENQLIYKYFSSKVKYGIYLIFYFGDKKNKEKFLNKVEESLPKEYKDNIKIICIDLTKTR